MGFTRPDLPQVDPDTFMQQPLMDRMKVLALHWVERGFGTPRMVHVIYIVKLAVFYTLGGAVVATATSHLPAFWHVGRWWNQPIVYEKAAAVEAGTAHCGRPAHHRGRGALPGAAGERDRGAGDAGRAKRLAGRPWRNRHTPIIQPARPTTR
jgi:Transmembrane protein of unknown function (DUF3556)